MKKYFVTGLVILLPLALTLAIVIFIFNFLTDPFVGMMQGLLDYFGLLHKQFLFLSSRQIQIAVSRFIILLLLFFFTVFLGAVGRWFFVHYIIKLWDYCLHSIPFVSSIYKTSQDVIKTIFTTKTKSFKQVVLVPFPNEATLSIGLVTRDHLPGVPVSEPSENMVAVFVPTTPNPTSGFLMIFKENDLLYLDMSVENALKYVISCGVILNPFKTITKEEAHQIILKASHENDYPVEQE
jgi:uncharacterized membrane protein